jgi:hypothetical protein
LLLVNFLLSPVYSLAQRRLLTCSTINSLAKRRPLYFLLSGVSFLAKRRFALCGFPATQAQYLVTVEEVRTRLIRNPPTRCQIRAINPIVSIATN